MATLTGPTFIALHTNNRTRAYGLGAYGDSTIISKGHITVVLDDSQVTAGAWDPLARCTLVQLMV